MKTKRQPHKHSPRNVEAY